MFAVAQIYCVAYFLDTCHRPQLSTLQLKDIVGNEETVKRFEMIAEEGTRIIATYKSRKLKLLALVLPRDAGNLPNIIIAGKRNRNTGIYFSL
jgi:hypothetical protein